MFLAVSSFNTLYQFWIHTRLIGRLGPLEWVLNTPSHHRVHHGAQPEVHRPQPRRHADRLGPAVRHLPARRRTSRSTASRSRSRAGIRSGRTCTTGPSCWDVARRARRPLDKAAGPLEAAGLAAGRPGRLRGPARGRPGDATSSTTCRCRAGVALYVLAQFVAVNVGTVAFLYESERLGPPARAGALAVVVEPRLPRRPPRPPALGGRARGRPRSCGRASPSSCCPSPDPAAGGVALAMVSATWILRGRTGKGLPLTAGLR